MIPTNRVFRYAVTGPFWRIWTDGVHVVARIER